MCFEAGDGPGHRQVERGRVVDFTTLRGREREAPGPASHSLRPSFALLALFFTVTTPLSRRDSPESESRRECWPAPSSFPLRSWQQIDAAGESIGECTLLPSGRSRCSVSIRRSPSAPETIVRRPSADSSAPQWTTPPKERGSVSVLSIGRRMQTSLRLAVCFIFCRWHRAPAGARKSVEVALHRERRSCARGARSRAQLEGPTAGG